MTRAHYIQRSQAPYCAAMAVLVALASAPSTAFSFERVHSGVAPLNSPPKVLEFHPAGGIAHVVRLDASVRTKQGLDDSSPGRPRPDSIGVVRDVSIPVPTTGWVSTGKGQVLRWRIQVAGAQALRVSFVGTPNATGTILKVSAGDSANSGVGTTVDGAGETWSGVVSGGSIVAELFAPDHVRLREGDLRLARVAEHFDNPQDPQGAKRWLAEPCQRDLACESESDATLARAGSASLRITWVHGSGVYACSATLLNAGDGSFRPYIHTAAHCLNDSDAAKSLVAHWFYEKSACAGNDVRAQAVQVPGGARLLVSDDGLDSSLLLLNQPPPDSVTYAGWDSTPLRQDEHVVALHHANGEVTKVSHGRVLPAPPYSFAAVGWTDGIVQGGSSGGGLFTRTAAPADLLFRGTLSSANASCSNPGMALVSRFDLFWPLVAPYLSKHSEHANATGLWWNPNRSGWGLSLNQQGGTMFGVLYGYESGAAVWWVASDMRRDQDGSFSGTLFRMSGGGFASEKKATSARAAGKLTVRPTSRHEADVEWEVDGRRTATPLMRQIYARAPLCVGTKSGREGATNFQDLWWNPDEPGWGLAIEHQENTLFGTLFTYGLDENATWLVASEISRRGDGSFEGAVYRMQGQPVEAEEWRAPTAHQAGKMKLHFSGGTQGSLTLELDGKTFERKITRQVFGETPPLCH